MSWWCWHKWSKWYLREVQFTIDIMPGVTWDETMQERECEKCGRYQRRKIRRH